MKIKLFNVAILVLITLFVSGCTKVTLLKQPPVKNYYTITFDLQGGEGDFSSTVLVEEKTRYPKINGFNTSTLQKENYVLDGFYSEPNGEGEKFEFISSVESDITLYAYWVVNTASENILELVLDYGTSEQEAFAVNKHARFPEKGALKAPMREGYVFLGWYETPDYSSNIVEYIENVEEEITLYAKWMEISEDATSEVITEFIIDFYPNGGFGIMNPQVFLVEEEKPLQANSFTSPEEGYYFAGWSIIQNGPVAYSDKSLIKPTEHLGLFAVWLETPSYLVKFDPGSGKGEMNSYLVKKGDAFILPANKFSAAYSKVGFAGWSIEKDNKPEYAMGQLVTIDEDTTFYATWSGMINITFDPNGGSGTMPTQTTIVRVEMKLEKNIFTAPVQNYKFTGWSTSPTGEVMFTDEGTYSFDSDTKLYAKWALKTTYTIDFKPNGGINNDNMVQQIVEEKTAITLRKNTFLRPHGQTAFGGWSPSANGSAIYKDEQVIIPTSDLVLYAKWVMMDPIEITYYPNGSSGRSYTQSTLKHSATELTSNKFPIPYGGVAFMGWSTTPKGSVVHKNREVVVLTANTQLYAVWAGINRVYFDAQDGKPKTILSGVPGSRIPAEGYFETPTSEEGAVFLGWYSEPNGQGVKYQYIESISSEITLYAYWLKPYTIGQILNIKLNLGYDNLFLTQTGMFESRVPQNGNLETPTREGYEFMGWFTGVTGYGTKVNYIEKISSNLTLHAHWKYVGNQTPYKLTLDLQGGTGTSQIEGIYNTRVPQTGNLPQPYKSGYIFTGWYTEKNGQGSKVDYIEAIFMDTTLYAGWEFYSNTSYTVNFNAQGGEAVPNLYGLQNTRLPKTGEFQHANKKGYSFVGWYTEPNGQGVKTNFISSISKNIVLYAHYQINTYEVKFDSEGGSALNPQNAIYNTRVPAEGKFSEPRKDGYVFMGWYTKDGGNGILKNYIKNIDNNVTLYAKWHKRDDNVNRAEKNYLHNLEVQKTMKGISSEGYILVQSTTLDFKYGNYSSDYNGCGWIAVFNALRYLQIQGLYEEEIVIADIIRYLDHYGLIMDGKFGTWPSAIASYLEALGLEANIYYNTDKFDEKIHNSDISITWRIITWSAHYQTISSADEGLLFLNPKEKFDNYKAYMDQEEKGLYFLLTIDAK